MVIWLEPEFVKSYVIKKHSERLESARDLAFVTEIVEDRDQQAFNRRLFAPEFRSSRDLKSFLVSDVPISSSKPANR